MSLLSRIQANTQSVSDGKYSLVTAIMGKGGDVPLTSNLPTFNQLVQGVESIPEGSEEVVASRGAVHVEALARENIQQYDSVKVLASSGNTTFVGNDLLPTVARYNADGTETTVNVNFYSTKQYVSTSTGISYISETGRFIVLGSGSYSAGTSISGVNGLYPFYLVGNEYKQLKIDGVYKPFPLSIGTSYLNLKGNYNSYNETRYGKVPIDLDEANFKIATSNSDNIISLYDLDINNLNIISDKDCTYGTSYNINIYSIILRNNHIFAEYNSTTDARTYVYYIGVFYINTDGSLEKISDLNSNTSGNIIVGYGTTITDNCFYLINFASGAGRLNKFRINSDTQKYVLITSVNLPKNSSVTCLNASASKLFICYNTALYVYTINDVNDTITFNDVTSQIFLDDTSIFDPTSVSTFDACRGGRYLLALKGDTSLNYEDRLVMLQYQFGDEEQGTASGYKVISYPLKDWTPLVVQNGIYPLLNRKYFLNTDQFIICTTSVGTTKIYESTNPGTGYYMQKTSNLLSNEVNLYGYGIATENVSTGQVGDASLNVINVF